MKVFGTVAAAALMASTSMVSALHGVPASQEHLYAGEVYTCDGGKQIASERINDDYCDCLDGSDEPGTAACTNGKFYCPNKGYRGKHVPASLVGDGVCDCCDGSDEAGGGATTCANTCEEEGAAWRVAEAERIAAEEAGARIKLQWIAEAASKASEEGQEAAEARAALAEAEAEVAAAKADVEREEAQEKALREAKEGSKEADFFVGLGLLDADASELRSVLLEYVAAVEAGANDYGYDKLVEVVQGRAYQSVLNNGGDAAGAAAAKQAVVLAGGMKESVASAVTTPEGDAARKALGEAETMVRDLKDVIEADAAKKEKDFGVQGEFRHLDGQCFVAKVQKYNYSVCPYGSAKQDSTRLGTWSGFESNYTVMKFTNGQKCWNGPNRSLTVKLECGVTTEVKGVSEPSTCSYEATMTTPAACDETLGGPVDTTLPGAKEEL